jgi:REP element-mobilizing transposase RayT
MARPLRVEYSGAVYHIINRGNAGENLYRSSRDREKFLYYLEKAVERFSLKIHTYCLMGNHFHILLETQHPNLSKSVQWITVSYAGYFNRKYKRNGHLFQGRFKSILVDADSYLKLLSRYIHLNPVRAGLADRPADYDWSSYNAFVDSVITPEWLETRWLLSQFGRKRKEAIANYKDFVETVDAKRSENPDKELTAGFILGAPDFISWVKESFLSNRTADKEIPQLRQLKPAIKIEMIVEAVRVEFNRDEAFLLNKGRKRNIARDTAIYLARDLTGESGKALGEYFGKISGAGITRRYNHMLKRIDTNRKLRKLVNRLRGKIVNN